jgi:predicted transcriptional regulator
MATLTIRNLPPDLVRSLKELAQRHHRSMEREVRELIELHVGDRLSAISQIERSWSTQARQPSIQEIEAWTKIGRP